MSDAKRAVRREALARRNALPPDVLRAGSKAVAERVLALPEWSRARRVASYVPIGSEVDTRPILEAALAGGKRLAVPRSLVAEGALALHAVERLDELAPGAFRVPEPDPGVHEDVHPADVDIVLVPGVAFDARGNRLGYGRGFFDRLLGLVPGLTVGVTLEALLVDEVPTEAHDVRVARVVTESRVIVTGA